MKYQKQAIKRVLIGKMPLCCCNLLSLGDRGYTKCCPLLSVWTLHRSNKYIIRNFTGVPIMDIIMDWESEIVNYLVCKKICQKIDFISQNESFVEKHSFTERFSFKRMEVQ